MAKKRIGLSGNVLKILAAVLMVCDHVGLMFFPSEIGFRIIGRLAFPIFAFMISEGARYTKNKLKYFLTIFLLATVCQLVYYFFDNGSLYMCILVTFSLSILLIYALNATKRALSESESPKYKYAICMGTLFLLLVVGVYVLTRYIQIDYGFAGIMTPVFASLFDFRGMNVPDKLKKLDNIPCRVLCTGIGLIMLSIQAGGPQYFCIFALLLLLLYSGERGKYKMKYFFYLFYPLHLVFLEAIYLLLLFVK